MRYQAEIIREGRVRVRESFFAYHPKQAIRKIVNRLTNAGSTRERLTVYVMSEEGSVWIYNLTKKTTDGYTARLVQRDMYVLPEDRIHMVFAGNTSIKDARRS